MKKITLLLGKLNFKKLQQLNKGVLPATNFQKNKKLPKENSGERSHQIMPEIGECHLAIALIQFEQERVKSLFVA